MSPNMEAINLITGFASGHVTIDGKDLKHIPSISKSFVMLFQCGSSPFKFKSFSIKFGIWNNSSSCFMCSTSKIY